MNTSLTNMYMEIVSIFLILLLSIFFFWMMYRSLKRSAYLSKLVAKYADMPKTQAVHEEIVDIIYQDIRGDSRLYKVLGRYGATREDIEDIYRKLLYWGDFRKRRRYLPITSFYYQGSLEYLLKHREEDAKKLTQHMMNFFHI